MYTDMRERVHCDNDIEGGHPTKPSPAKPSGTKMAWPSRTKVDDLSKSDDEQLGPQDKI